MILVSLFPYQAIEVLAQLDDITAIAMPGCMRITHIKDENL